MKYFFEIYLKVNQVIFSSLSIYSSSYEALSPTVLRYFADKGKMPKFTKGHAQKQYVPPTFFSPLSIYVSSYDALAPTVFEIFCGQGKHV